MGSVLRTGSPSQRLPTRLYKGECAEGSDHWRFVDPIKTEVVPLHCHTNHSIEGELVDLLDDFSDGRVQFAFVKVKDPNSGLPKNVLIAWVSTLTPLSSP